MSTTITLTVSKPVPREIITGSDPRNQWIDLGDDEANVPEGTSNVWMPGISTRATEITVAGSTFEVRIFSGACEADIELALDIVERVSTWVPCMTVDSETAGEISINDLREVHDAEWIRAQALSFGRIMRYMAAERGPITLPSPIGSVVIGPRVLAKLPDGSDEIGTANTLFDIMRNVLHSDATRKRVFNYSDSSTDDTTRTFVVWSGAERELLPPSDDIGVGLGDLEPVLVARSAFLALNLPPWQLLDDANVLIEPTDPSRHHEIHRDATALALPPPNKPAQRDPKGLLGRLRNRRT